MGRGASLRGTTRIPAESEPDSHLHCLSPELFRTRFPLACRTCHQAMFGEDRFFSMKPSRDRVNLWESTSDFVERSS
jgi:hypothetical protein